MSVPCGICALCCQHQTIVLDLQAGDIFTDYECYLSNGRWVLRNKPNGDCIYWDGGCTIYPNRPSICKAFDCRELAVAIRAESSNSKLPPIIARGIELVRLERINMESEDDPAAFLGNLQEKHDT